MHQYAFSLCHTQVFHLHLITEAEPASRNVVWFFKMLGDVPRLRKKSVSVNAAQSLTNRIGKAI